MLSTLPFFLLHLFPLSFPKVDYREKYFAKKSVPDSILSLLYLLVTEGDQ